MDHAPKLREWSNELLAAFPDAILALLKRHLFHATLRQGTICFNAGDVAERVYFPTSGLISLLVPAGDDALVEADVIGNEGAVGLQSAVWSRPCFARAVVQVPGEFWSVSAEALRQVIHMSDEANGLVSNYTEILWARAQQLATCNAIHATLPRLARWILQAKDRSELDRLPLTQEFLAKILGVRRTSVTFLAQRLQDRGIIRYSRANIVILDRAALEAVACQCYQIIRHLQRRAPENCGVVAKGGISPRQQC
jgi:CRP-like cAMP-binding protein